MLSARSSIASACGVPTLLGHSRSTAAASRRAAPPERPVRASGRRLERQPARNPRRLAGVERHVQMLGDEIRGADDVDQPEARRRRPAGVQAQEHLGVDVFAAPAARSRSPRQREPCAPPQQPDHGGARAARRSCSPTLSSTRRIRSSPRSMCPPVRNCSAARRCSSTCRRVSRSRRGAQVGLGGLRRPAGVGERGRRALLSTRRRVGDDGASSSA